MEHSIAEGRGKKRGKMWEGQKGERGARESIIIFMGMEDI
jgi:hypothetical protein